ncbi:MAG: glutamine synthetase, partial [Planctomycetota bacterium]|nr:glutamine synthetase [Planctomycetota bacterium]
MSNHEMSPEQIIEEVSQSRARFVKLAVTDIDGVLRGKYVHKDKFLSVIQGNLGFCDVIFGWDINDQCYDNSQFTGWHTGYPDAEAQLDLSTLRWIPWEDDVPFFLGDFAQTKGTAPPCPRRVLKDVISQATAMGLHSAF